MTVVWDHYMHNLIRGGPIFFIIDLLLHHKFCCVKSTVGHKHERNNTHIPYVRLHKSGYKEYCIDHHLNMASLE